MSVIGNTLRSMASSTPTIEEIGGEELVYSEMTTLLNDPSLTDVVRLLCRSWPDLKRPEVAAEFVVSATRSVHLGEFADILDVLLGSAEVLPAVAGGLVKNLRDEVRTMDVRADIAAEGWTRLALGEWCRSLEVRSALVGLADDGHTSPFLIRALGAALAEWHDTDIEQSMVRLVNDKDVESDIAMELGAYRLVKAAESTTEALAIAELQESVRWFARANNAEERRDAPAFHLATSSLLAFADGRPIDAETVANLENAATEYLLLYRNLEPHWRQPRAQAISEWVSLVESMRRVSALDEPAWFEPAALIDQAAALFCAHQSLTLVVHVGTNSEELPSVGVAAIVQPRIKAGFAAQAHSVSFLDQWLAMKERESQSGEYISDVYRRFARSIAELVDRTGGSPPKASSGPLDDLLAARRLLRTKAASESPSMRTAIIGATPLVIPARELGLEEERVVRRILGDSAALVGPLAPEVEKEAISLLAVMVKYSSYLINQVQSGERKVPFLGISEAPFPAEYHLADGLNDRLLSHGLPSQIERTDVGGGRVDIALQFARFQLFVEVKRELTVRSNVDLFASYADQAVQYAGTDIPLAFLAVLDFSRHEVRVDLDHAFWTAAHSTATSRVYAVTGLRVQGNVASPSKSSRSRSAARTRSNVADASTHG